MLGLRVGVTSFAISLMFPGSGDIIETSDVYNNTCRDYFNHSEYTVMAAKRIFLLTQRNSPPAEKFGASFASRVFSRNENMKIMTLIFEYN